MSRDNPPYTLIPGVPRFHCNCCGDDFDDYFASEILGCASVECLQCGEETYLIERSEWTRARDWPYASLGPAPE